MEEMAGKERLDVLQDYISGLSRHDDLRAFDGTVICCLAQILNYLKRDRCTENV